jgi:alanyl-tRNA synthetase
LEVPPDEFKLPFFQENGFLRKRCPLCHSHFWTQNPDQETCGDAPCVSYTFIGDPPTRMRLTVPEMREQFLSFFEKRGHGRVRPYPVVARWRDDLMVTIASIVDFQPYVIEGVIPPPSNPLVVSQPCMRFEDIDLVGPTFGRHLTIFEMGGHHAFNYEGQPEIYWKDQTVRYHHELLCDELGVPSEMVTYKEGLWSGGGNAGYDLEGCVAGLEVSTLVFMMYRVIDDRLEPMPCRVVDTGYGVERWSWLTLGSPSAFHAIYGPILENLLKEAGISIDEVMLAEAAKHSCVSRAEELLEARGRLAKLLGLERGELLGILRPLEAVYTALDHTKGLVFLLSEGVVPSNVKEGYLARLLLRRAYRMLRRAGIEVRLLDLVEAQVEYWGGDFPQLREMRDEIIEMVEVEVEKYRETLRRGGSLVRRLLRRRPTIEVDTLVELYDSHGLTPEDVGEVASTMGVSIETPEDFYALVARRHMAGVAAEMVEGKPEVDVKGLPKTRLLYYEDAYKRDFTARILAVLDNQYVVLDKTAFYPEGGGQPADTGWLVKGDEKRRVIDVQSVEGVILHRIEGINLFEEGDEVRGLLDWERRYALMRSHTATHILIGAARRALGLHAWQAGTQKGVERSRLDVSHYRRLTRGEIEEIERLANQAIWEGRPVRCRWMPRNEAEERYGFKLYQGGAIPGGEIRVVEIEDWDVEACGGTHVGNTHEVGLIKIVATERVQDGVERLIYSAGPHGLSEIQRREEILVRAAETLGAPMEKLAEAVANTLENVRRLRKELNTLMREASRGRAEKLLREAEEVEGVRLIIEAERTPLDYLIEVGNALAELQTNIVAVLLSENDGRFIVKAGDGAVEKGVHAGRVAAAVAKAIGGGGGGKPHFAQGGGGDPSRLPMAVEVVKDALRGQLREGGKPQHKNPL